MDLKVRLHHKKYTPLIKKLGVLFAIVVPAGFAAMPIYVLGHYLYTMQ